MSPYTFFPGIVNTRFFSSMPMRVVVDFTGIADEDRPVIELFNPVGATADYDAKWRHVNP